MLIEEPEFKRRFVARFKALYAERSDELATSLAPVVWLDYAADEAPCPEWYAEFAVALLASEATPRAAVPPAPPAAPTRGERSGRFNVGAAIFGASVGAFATAVLLATAGPDAWEWLGPVGGIGIILIVGGGVLAGIAFGEREGGE